METTTATKTDLTVANIIRQQIGNMAFRMLGDVIEANTGLYTRL